MNKRGFYKIKDDFFKEMNDPYLKGNKEGRRPHYYCIEDKIEGIYWMVPLSSKVEKFKYIINMKEKSGKACDTIHILKLDNGKESVFLFQDMFPITEEYIDCPYTLWEKQIFVSSDKSARILEKKAHKVIGLIKRQVKFLPTQVNALEIYNRLKKIMICIFLCVLY